MDLIEDNLLISDDVFDRNFCCDCDLCGGICCVEGDSGAPLEKEECLLLEKEWQAYRPYMQKAGIKAVEEQGTWVTDRDNDRVTPLIEGKECAYAFFENGACLCAIERAWNQGKTAFRKPISCWLYPIRVQKISEDTLALNYHKWHLCHQACVKGDALGIKVYQFLKEPLIARFGAQTYKEIEEAAHARNEKR